MVEAAVDEGYNTIVMPGFAFAETISQVADTYPDVNFIALDVAESDVGTIPGNTYCAVYQEELAGYMAGVAAVKLGYSHLGFLGGMAVPRCSGSATASCRARTLRRVRLART